MFLFSLLSATVALQNPQVASQPPKTPESPAKTKVVARVEGRDITAGEIEPFLWDWYGYSAREEFIMTRAIEAKADALKLTASVAEIQTAYDAQLSQLKANLQGASMDSYLQVRGGSLTRIWMGARREVLLQKILLQAFKPEDFISVSTLLIRSKSEAASDLGVAIKRAQDAYDELSKGSKWGNVYRKYNVEMNSPSDGFVGWVMISNFPKTTQAELASLKTGQVTKPVQTQYGLQLFKIERRAADAPAAEMANLKTQFVQSGKRTYLENLMKATKVERF